jgi:hypothetical protein
MGINGFKKTRCYQTALVPVHDVVQRVGRDECCSILAIDATSLIHLTVESEVRRFGTCSKEALLAHLTKDIIGTVERFAAKHVGVFFDGPPPHAKLAAMKKKCYKEPNARELKAWDLKVCISYQLPEHNYPEQC